MNQYFQQIMHEQLDTCMQKMNLCADILPLIKTNWNSYKPKSNIKND